MSELTICGKESDGSTGGTSTTSTSNTMNVIFRVIGIVVVQHVSDILDIFARLAFIMEQRKSSEPNKDRVMTMVLLCIALCSSDPPVGGRLLPGVATQMVLESNGIMQLE